ncbi:MAG: SRPBCC domain-containing protein [Bacteroidetes bacterium]|nr:SRPBCC domain-containing protein [Bacteroidota bacterium]
MDKLEAYLAKINEAQNELVIVREFNAPRELVFKAWTEAQHLAKWWGPKGLDLMVNKLDLQPGGIFHYRMIAPDGTTLWGRFIYKEIVSPEKLVFISSFSDEKGDIKSMPMLPVFPAEILNIVTFEERNGKTILTLKGHPVNASKEEMDVYHSMFENMNAGFAGTLDKLYAHLEALKETV